MAWLRIDDSFPEHPKILELGSADRRWTWLCLLAWTARQRSPIVPANIRDAIAKATPAYLADCERIGLLDRGDDGCLEVHDWRKYQPKDPGAAERQMLNRGRAPQPRGGRWEQTRRQVWERDHGICADCGKDCKRSDDGRDLWNADHEPPRDQLVTAGISIYDIDYIVTRCHSCHAKKTRRQAQERRLMTEPETEPEANIDRTKTERDDPVFGLSRAAARARTRPVPSLEPSPSFQPDLEHHDLLPGDEPQPDGRKDTSNGEIETLADWATRTEDTRA